VALEVVDLLERAGMKTAIGGAIAFGFWGPPRGTKDVDLNVFVGESRFEELLATLERGGCAPKLDREDWTPEDRLELLRRLTEGDVAVVYKDHMRVDVFVPSIDFYSEAERTLKEVPLRGRRVLVLSAESITIFKLLFFRDKDLVDVRRLVALQGPALDRAYVRDQLVSMVGPDDERIAAWDEVVKTHGSG